ncbi:MAG TPA: ABC transporter permease [Desertimonas sp.]|nr:ABC transporter permease [Desertimonas sp.]
MTATTLNSWTAPPPARAGLHVPGPLWLWGALAAMLAMSITRSITDNGDLTSSGTMSVAIRTAAPIAMCGLGGLYAERSGTVNIGLEGMMILGTVFGGWWGWEFGPWGALVGGVVGGFCGGLLLAIVTTTFGVNHIVAGFAINILAPGVARFMSTVLFVDEQGGSLTNSPGVTGDIGEFTMPFLSGGQLFGRETPDVLGRIDEWNWFAVSDVAGMLKGLTAGVRYDVLVGVGLFAATVFLLWHTRFGLRLRSAGERPSAADSLGVRVHLYRYFGASISGALAGLGGAMLVISAGRYSQGMTVGKGFLGLATLVVGNWRPVGVAIGASIFGFFDGVTQRLSPEDLVLALLLAAALLLFAGTIYAFVTKGASAMRFVAAGVSAFGVFVVLRAFFYELGGSVAVFLLWLVVGMAITTAGVVGAVRFGGLSAAIMAMAAVAALFVYLRLDAIPDEFVPMLPYVVTLVVVSSRGQALRPPAAAGEPWFKGQQT